MARKRESKQTYRDSSLPNSASEARSRVPLRDPDSLIDDIDQLLSKILVEAARVRFRAWPTTLNGPFPRAAAGWRAVLVKDPLREILTEALNGLVPSERLVLALRYVERLTLGEMAAVLGTNQRNVSQLYCQAALSLRGRLKSSKVLAEPNP
ncbi:MAG: sigma factor-like helix-turn-helix DNA-binding protein [Acidobacteriota bacterium]